MYKTREKKISLRSNIPWLLDLTELQKFRDHHCTFQAVRQHPHQCTTQMTAVLLDIDLKKRTCKKTPVYSIYEAEGEGIEATL